MIYWVDHQPTEENLEISNIIILSQKKLYKLTILWTFSGRLLSRQSSRCLLISNEGENGPNAPLLASIHRLRISLATTPEVQSHYSSRPRQWCHQCQYHLSISPPRPDSQQMLQRPQILIMRTMIHIHASIFTAQDLWWKFCSTVILYRTSIFWNCR